MKTAMIIAALIGATPATAQVSVGVIDTRPFVIKQNNVDVVVLNPDSPLVRQQSGITHGADTVYSIVSEFKPTDTNKLTVYVASPYKNAAIKADNAVRMDWNQAFSALRFFSKHNVKYVCTTFVTTDSVNAGIFVKFANDLGLTVVASAGNGEVEHPYPAAIPAVISVAATNSDAYIKQSAKVVYNGMAGRRSISNQQDQGSSFAAARYCGALAAQVTSTSK